MTVREFTYLIGNGEYFPKIYAKVDKENNKFLYCIVLYILEGEETKELCHCDNYHNKGHHIHYKKFNGDEKQSKFEFKSIGKTMDFLIKDWRKIMEEMKK